MKRDPNQKHLFLIPAVVEVLIFFRNVFFPFVKTFFDEIYIKIEFIRTAVKTGAKHIKSK